MDDQARADIKAAAAAAAAIAAKREIDGAIAELAASPLDVPAAGRMREVLGSPKLRKARRALTRAPQQGRTELTVVDGGTGEEPGEGEQAEEAEPRTVGELFAGIGRGSSRLAAELVDGVWPAPGGAA